MTIFKKKIRVDAILSQHLVFRDAVSDLFDYIKNMNVTKVVLDFSHVKSISRSFAQEYLHQLDKQSIKIKEVNMSLQLKKMFRSVKKAHRKSSPLNLNDIKELSIQDIIKQKND
ncbi:MAG TPA: DUF4325 domain-containing protein [Candidatus Thermoplasmatota archaeon]|nr:DUF4325 domain-containing protein [Candidatus Thermoplasmatota archaeon]